MFKYFTIFLLLWGCDSHSSLNFACRPSNGSWTYISETGQKHIFRNVDNGFTIIQDKKKVLEPGDNSEIFVSSPIRPNTFLLSNIIAVPANIYDIQSWKIDGLSCNKARASAVSHDGVVSAECVSELHKSTFEFKFSKARGLISLYESCEFCGKNEQLTLLKGDGIGKPCA